MCVVVRRTSECSIKQKSLGSESLGAAYETWQAHNSPDLIRFSPAKKRVDSFSTSLRHALVASSCETITTRAGKEPNPLI